MIRLSLESVFAANDSNSEVLKDWIQLAKSDNFPKKFLEQKHRCSLGSLISAKWNELDIHIAIDKAIQWQNLRCHLNGADRKNNACCRILTLTLPCIPFKILSQSTIPTLQTSIVCGAANNQLLTPEDNKLLDRMGITYVVDFAANRMGIVNCANETYGYVKDDPYIEKHLGREWENSVSKSMQYLMLTFNDCVTCLMLKRSTLQCLAYLRLTQIPFAVYPHIWDTDTIPYTGQNHIWGDAL